MAKFLQAAATGDVDTLDHLFEGPNSEQYTTSNTPFEELAPGSPSLKGGSSDDAHTSSNASAASSSLGSPSPTRPQQMTKKTTKKSDNKNALHLAAMYGQTLAVRWMLQNNFDVNRKTSKGTTPFLLACSGGHLKTVEELLLRGADVNDADNVSAAYFDHTNEAQLCSFLLLQLGRNALHLAILPGHLDTAKWLVDKWKFSIHCQTTRKMLPIHFAALGGSIDVVDWLLEQGSPADCVSADGLTPLLLASSQGHLTIVRRFLEKGADPYVSDRSGRTVLHLACANARVDTVMFFLEKYRLSPEKKDSKGNSPLDIAGECVKQESIKRNPKEYQKFKTIYQALLSTVEPPPTPVLTDAYEIRDNMLRIKWKIPKTPPCAPQIESYQLHVYKEWSLGSGKEIPLPLRAVGTSNPGDGEESQTAPDSSSSEPTLFVELTVPSGSLAVKIKAQNKNGWSAYSNKLSEIQVGQKTSNSETDSVGGQSSHTRFSVDNVDQTQAKPPQCEQKHLPKVSMDEEENKALFEAAATGNVQRLTELAKEGVVLAVSRDDGRTPLHLAAKGGYVRAIKWLASNSIPIDAIDEYGATAFLLAVVAGRTLAAIELYKLGANLDDADRNGYNALAYSVIKQHYHLFRWLLDAGASSAVNSDSISIYDVIKRDAKDSWKQTLLNMLKNSGSLPPQPPAPVTVDRSWYSLFVAAPCIPRGDYPPGCPVVEEVEFQYCRKISLNPFWETVSDKISVSTNFSEYVYGGNYMSPNELPKQSSKSSSEPSETVLSDAVEGIYGALTIENLSANTNYLLRMRVRNRHGWSEYSAKSEEVCTRRVEDKHPIVPGRLMMMLQNEIFEAQASAGLMVAQTIKKLPHEEVKQAVRRGDDFILGTHPQTVSIRNCLVKKVAAALDLSDADIVNLLQAPLEEDEPIKAWDDDSENARQNKLNYVELLHVACSSARIEIARKLLGLRLLSPQQEGIEPTWLNHNWVNYAHTSLQFMYAFLKEVGADVPPIITSAAAMDIGLLSNENASVLFKATFTYITLVEFGVSCEVGYDPNNPKQSVELFERCLTNESERVADKLLADTVSPFTVPQTASAAGNVPALEVIKRIPGILQKIGKPRDHPIFFSCVCPTIIYETNVSSSTSTLQFWIKSDPSLVHLKDAENRSLAHLCAGCGDISKLQYLDTIKECEPLWYEREAHGWFPIHYAICSDSYVCVAWLLSLHLVREDLPRDTVASLEEFTREKGNLFITHIVHEWSSAPPCLEMALSIPDNEHVRLQWSLPPTSNAGTNIKIPVWPIKELQVQVSPFNPYSYNLGNEYLIHEVDTVDVTQLFAIRDLSGIVQSSVVLKEPKGEGVLSLPMESSSVNRRGSCFIRLRGRTKRGWSCFSHWGELRLPST